MNVDVWIQSADLKGALGTYIKRRLHFALGRFTGKLGRVSVRIELLPNGRTLRQEAVDRNLYIAIDLAIERIARTFEREQDWVRSLGTARNPESVASHSQDKFQMTTLKGKSRNQNKEEQWNRQQSRQSSLPAHFLVSACEWNSRRRPASAEPVEPM